jgi:hypothetical protein
VAAFAKASAMATNWETVAALFEQSLDMTGVKTVEQFEEKKRMASEGLARLEKLRDFHGKIAEAFRHEMLRRNFDPKKVDRAVAIYAHETKAGQERRDRALEPWAGFGESVQEMHRFLEGNWGQWVFVETNGMFTFSDTKLAATYRRQDVKIEGSASNMSAALQARLVAK